MYVSRHCASSGWHWPVELAHWQTSQELFIPAVLWYNQNSIVHAPLKLDVDNPSIVNPVEELRGRKSDLVPNFA
jgi:hypothetical protein